VRVCLLVALILGLVAAPAAADTEPLPPGTTIVPRDGEVWTASSWPGATPFEMHQLAVYASDYDELPDTFAFAVAATPATDADGLLAAPIDGYAAPAQPEHVGIYAATTSLGAEWLGTPGTYYWQASYVDDEDGDTYASPVRSLQVIPPPPPDVPQPLIPIGPPPARPLPAATPRPPDPRTVRTAVRRAIHAATHRVAHKLVYRCVRAPAAATCRPSWRDVRNRYRGTLRLAFGANPITATFRGKRVPRRHGHARAVTWATTL
jgi:hypothetical protein